MKQPDCLVVQLAGMAGFSDEWLLEDLARAQMFLAQDAVDRELLLQIIGRHGLQSKWAEFESKIT